MTHFGAMHATIGTAVIGVNLIVALLLMSDRRNRRPIGAGKKIVAYLGQLILLVQIVIGLDLWFDGFRPANGLWGYLHMLLPLGALLFAIMMLVRMRGKQLKEHATFLSKGAWHTTLVAVLTYLIGELG